MLYIEQSFDSPAANLVADVMLLEQCEDSGNEILRTWSPNRPAVILGRGNDPSTNVDLAACMRDRISVLRRESGGGTVLLGPGCLCYSLVMRIESDPDLVGAAGANAFFLRKLSEAFGREVSVAGESDLVVGKRKIAGHAQRRKQRSVLFHGSLLVSMDLELIAHYLPIPARRPDYREGRRHLDFLQNRPWNMAEARKELRKVFNVQYSATELSEEAVLNRAAQIYSDPHWGVNMPYATKLQQGGSKAASEE